MSESLAISEWSEEDVLKCTICSGNVVDAVLLSCLHSACRLCTESDRSTDVTCPTCNVTTDATTRKTNLLISSLAQRSQLLQNVFTCTRCIEDKQLDLPAVALCDTCQKSLCIDCQELHCKFHSTHNLIPLNECTNFSELYRPPARRCQRHGEEVKLACFTCKTGRCLHCAHGCYTSNHDVLPLDDPDSLLRMTDCSKQISDARIELRSAVNLLQAHLSLPQKVLSAREESISRLQGEKKMAIDSISDAYKKAATSLLDCWDSVLAHSLILREKAHRHHARASWTDQYCRLVSNSSDIGAVLPQLENVLSSIRTCLEEAREFKEPADPSSFTRFNTRLPADLDQITNGWFGSAELVTDSVNCAFTVCQAEKNTDYYNLKVSTLNELQLLLRSQKEEKEAIQTERQAMVKLQSEVVEMDGQLAEIQNAVKNLLNQQKDVREQLERGRKCMLILQSDMSWKAQQLDAKDKDIKQLQEQHKELQGQLEGQRRTVAQQQSELTKRTQELDAEKNEVKTLLGKLKQLQEQLHRERRTVEMLQSEAAPTKPLSFDGKLRVTFKGPGCCRDVAVTPQSSLLVAAAADGLKEYDATRSFFTTTGFRERSTWKPDSDLLGQEKSFFQVTTVDVLSDGRAVVGLYPKLLILLRRGSSAAEPWRVERRVAELQGSPRRLSAWADRLLAVLEDRYHESTNSWCCGPDLVLLSLCDGGSDMQLHRQQLDYNAGSVALTDRCVIVSSVDQVEITEAPGGGGGSRKCYVLDCYSHQGVRLWRHEVGRGLNVMSVCTDTVGRVLYAAKNWRSVAALRVDDGRELSTAITLSSTETQEPYAIRLDKSTQRLLALISRVAFYEPNIITTFTAV